MNKICILAIIGKLQRKKDKERKETRRERQEKKEKERDIETKDKMTISGSENL